MPFDLSDKLVVAVSSRALFDLRKEHEIFESQGLEAFKDYQLLHEAAPLSPGTAFDIVESLLKLNEQGSHFVEVMILSKNHPDISLRVQNSIKTYGLPISRSGLTGGGAVTNYAKALKADLFLSADLSDVRDHVKAGLAAGLVYPPPAGEKNSKDATIRIAFDGDCVLFSGQAEAINQCDGLAAFHEHEDRKADLPLPDGPFAALLRKLSKMRKANGHPFRFALVTARNAPAHQRAIKTLRNWEVELDEAFFLGGLDKTGVLAVFRPQIFFDDTAKHCDAAAPLVRTALVPYAIQIPALSVPVPLPTRDRFLTLCGSYLGKKSGQLTEFEDWYAVKLSQSAESLQMRFVVRMEESLRGTVVGLDRRSKGKRDTNANKLILYLNRLASQIEKQGDVE